MEPVVPFTSSPTSDPALLPPMDEDTATRGETVAEKGNPASHHFFKPPKLKQYWHDGVLYHSPSSDLDISVLFVDLLYVGIIAVNADTTMEDPTNDAFLRFCVTFLPSWKIWSDIAILVSQFQTDSFTQRSIILFILACLVGFTTNVYSAFWDTYGQLVGFYLASRVCVALITILLAFFIPLVRPIMILNFVSIIIPIAFWIASCFVINNRETFIWLAICWDIWGSLISVVIIKDIPRHSQSLGKHVNRIFTHFPAVDLKHRAERVGAFVSLVFGYSVVGILYQSNAKFGMNAFYGKAVLGLIQAYFFNWLYFDVDEKYLYSKQAERHTVSAALWFNAHLPFIMAFTLSSAALSRLVVAHDSANTSPEWLNPAYEEKSEEVLSDSLRWFYCAGLGTAFIFMGVISFARGGIKRSNERIPQIYRLIFRTGVGATWICLPLAEQLNSLELIAITCSMTAVTLLVDSYGMQSRDKLPRERTASYEETKVDRKDTMFG